EFCKTREGLGAIAAETDLVLSDKLLQLLLAVLEHRKYRGLCFYRKVNSIHNDVISGPRCEIVRNLLVLKRLLETFIMFCDHLGFSVIKQFIESILDRTCIVPGEIYK